MPSDEETNVRLPRCALDALMAVATRRRISRAEAVRQLLDEHLALQEGRVPADRLTHISTVLRYPSPPRWRGDPRADRPLRLRLASGVTTRARAVSLRLPGQSPRAHRDYQPRLLTDAVMTAIAVQEPFDDEFLAGLLPLLRHDAALGLWRLAQAATSTGPENAIHTAAEGARLQVGGPASWQSAEEHAAQQRLLLVAETLDEDVSWHSPARFEVATNIARDLLTGPNADINEDMLYQQRVDDWGELLLDLRAGGTARDTYRQGLNRYDWAGRGGAAVWRAERKVEIQDFEAWLARPHQPGPIERVNNPPGWGLCLPDGWCAVQTSTAIPEPYATWLADGRLLAYPLDERKMVLWPLIRHGNRSKGGPIPGIEPVIAAADGLRPEQISGFAEAVLLDWNAEQNEDAIPSGLRLPVHRAFDFGLVTTAERQYAMAEARAATQREMTALIGSLSEDQSHYRKQLEQLQGNTREFGSFVKQMKIKPWFRPVQATWRWQRGSVVDEIARGTRADVVRWLAGEAHLAARRLLQWSMQGAWDAAFDHRPGAYWLPRTDVTPTITEAPGTSFGMDPAAPF